MRYQIPGEVPPGRLARFAVRAITPYWAALVTGALPGILWGAANAWALGCRDARRQTIIALVGYSLIASWGALRIWLITSGTFDALFGADGSLANALMLSAHLIATLGLLRYLAGRQIDIAVYRNTLGRKLPWGILVTLALVGLYVFGVRPLFTLSDHFVWAWGPMLL